MVGFLKRNARSLLRLSTVREVNHHAVFRQFADNVGRAIVDRRVRDEPRVVSFPWRALR